jgi:perosamine synthetase
MNFIHQIEPSIGEEEIREVEAYLRSGGWLTEFKRTEEFENLICKATGAGYASVVNNGTISLSIALVALGLKAGDEVIVPNLTMIASPNACTLLGIKPILVDISEEDLCLDFDEMKKKITPKTKAVMFVSLNGRGKNINKFQDFCKSSNLFLLEDAAQSMGSKVDGIALGTFGDIGSFSFSPHKIITTGQGGALVTNNKNLYENVERTKDFGRLSGGADIHDYFGINSKFTDFQAVIGIEQIKKLEERIKKKKEIYSLYEKNFKGNPKIKMIPTDLNDTCPWFVDVYVNDPEGLQKHLKENGIGSRPVYPPIHKQKIFNLSETFPVSEKYCSMGLWLPSSLLLTENMILSISESIIKYVDKH